MALLPLRLNRWSGCRRCLQRERVDGVGGEGCGGGRRRWRRLWRPRKRWCRRRRPVVSASSSSLPKNCAADSFISAQLNWPAAVVRACPAAPLHRDRAACRFGHSSLRDLRVLKEGRLAAGCSVAGRYVTSSMPTGSTSPAMEVNKKSMLTRRASSLVAKAGRAPAAKLGVKREEPWRRRSRKKI